jgi:hypothetical protein
VQMFLTYYRRGFSFAASAFLKPCSPATFGFFAPGFAIMLL